MRTEGKKTETGQRGLTSRELQSVLRELEPFLLFIIHKYRRSSHGCLKEQQNWAVMVTMTAAQVMHPRMADVACQKQYDTHSLYLDFRRVQEV